MGTGRKRGGRVARATIAVLSSVAIGAAVAPSAQAATYLGGTNLLGACQAFWWDVPGTARVYTVAPHDAGTWRCNWKSATNGQWVTVGFDMNRVCRWQYGSGAYARALNWSDRYSWRCYR